MIPFMTEDIYQNLVRSIDANAPESIHLCDFPEVNEDHIDKELEENMDRCSETGCYGTCMPKQLPISRTVSRSDRCMSKLTLSFRSSIRRSSQMS